MYLKSLTLKGFKSFADRTVMVFDPGLTVVVGPNGSGKSNVSDAILWVLGEQSAKMLRGQSMEDVIFSGSTARGAVGVAEVTLVLDNTDHTLPIDFAEVAITRRMYRSGESEYLINGAPSRLLDVQDILHDSGLGKETHSIISQGKLDSILQSRPEERRELVEEAAGISKHRRRKERSERKLKGMDENLARAKVLQREINRQLKPLERQVDKARRAHDLERQLKEVTTQLAVDDLRQLQDQYGRLSVRGREAEAAVELAQYRLDEKSRELEKLQSLLEEKGKNMVSRLSDMRMSLSTMRKQRTDAQRDHDRVADQLAESRAREGELKGRVEELSRASREAVDARRRLDAELDRLQKAERAARDESDRETLAYARLEEQVKNAEVEDQMYASRLRQIDEQAETAQAALAARERRREELDDLLSTARAAADDAQAKVPELQAALRDARRAEQDARSRLNGSEATLKALRSVDADVEKASPLVAAVAKSPEAQGRVVCRVADLVDADPEVEPLVERLLGDDLAAFVVASDADAAELAQGALRLARKGGRAVVVSQAAPARAVVEGAPGASLVARLRVDEESRPLIEALLGDVRLVATVAEAVAAHAQAPALTYVAADGSTVLPDGRVVVGSTPTNERGALERKRRIRALEAGLAGEREALEEAGAAVAAAEGALNAARDAAAQAKGEAARLQGELSSVTSESGRLEGQLSSATSEREQVTRSRASAAQKAERARGQVEGHRAAAKAATARAEELAHQLEDVRAQHEDAIHAQGKASHDLSDGRIQLAMTGERRQNLERRERDLSRNVRDLDQRIEQTQQSARALDVVRLRVDPLHARYDAIRTRAQEWAARLKDRASLAEADSDSLKRTIGEAKDARDAATKELDEAKSAANAVKVDMGRLEAQVQAAVERIVATGAVLDEALQLPAPDDRERSERLAADLRRQMDSIGPVNEVAMDEYDRLKERADYIAGQVEDLERARVALRKITSAIDRKMRTRFVTVFERVNKNFSEIFSMLFPGGQAHLELTDPEHLSETGVEVVAQPRGKKIQKMTLMSGGERSLTALALLFAVYRTRTVPFYVFDEVEAALDDSNLSRLLDAIEQLKESTQLIVISHQRRTMEQADVLYGVSMQADGVSHVVSQRLDHATGRVVDA